MILKRNFININIMKCCKNCNNNKINNNFKHYCRPCYQHIYKLCDGIHTEELIEYFEASYNIKMKDIVQKFTFRRIYNIIKVIFPNLLSLSAIVESILYLKHTLMMYKSYKH